MRVLIITGDKKFFASPRFALQAAQVERLEVVYWGHGSMWPIRYVDISKFQPDVITVQDPFWRGFFAWWIARRIGARLNIQVHTDLFAQDSPKRFMAMARFVLRRADSVRVVSEKIKQQVERAGVTAPIRVLPIYIDVSRFNNIVRHPSKSDLLGKTILWVGRFEDEKDPLLALEVIKKVPGAKLIMLGAGSLQGRLQAEVARFNLAKDVELPGWQDPAAYLAQADVVLCTSRHESYGASIIEALAAGVPVVAPDVGVAREAGAEIVERSNLAQKVIEVLTSGQRGELKLQLPSAQEWAKQWKETL